MTEEQLKEHVYQVHADVTSRTHVYRCISVFSYLLPKASNYHAYGDLITQAKSVGSDFKVLDIGTCFGQEARGMIVDGVPPESVYVTDLHDFYWNTGLRLFDVPNSAFSASKVHTFFGNLATEFDPTNSADIVTSMKDSFHGVMCMAILHVLTREESVHMLKRVHYILKPGGVVFGYAVGAPVACQWGRTPTESGQRWLHDVATLEATFRDCGYRDISVKQKAHQALTVIEDDGIEKLILVFTAKKE